MNATLIIHLTAFNNCYSLQAPKILLNTPLCKNCTVILIIFLKHSTNIKQKINKRPYLEDTYKLYIFVYVFFILKNSIIMLFSYYGVLLKVR